MKLVSGALLLFTAWTLHAQAQRPQTVSARSRSGQFVVLTSSNESRRPAVTSRPGFVRLDAASLAISCERVKQELLTQLDSQDLWQSKIYFVLLPARTTNDSIVVTASYFTDGWQYQLEIPDELPEDRFVRALVQTLCLEMANRGARARSSELPAWLSQGLAGYLQAESEMDLVVQATTSNPNRFDVRVSSRDTRRITPLERVKETLRAASPLSLYELTWPTHEQLSGTNRVLYRASAELFVGKLLRLKQGKASLRNFILSLPGHENWQTPFLKAFHSEFAGALDLEKWWALESAHFTAHEAAQLWPLETSWKKFDDIVFPTAEVRLGSEDLPMRVPVKLQTVLTEWSWAEQEPLLKARLQQLQFIRLRLARPLLPLADGYARTLQTYLQRSRGQSKPGKRFIEQTVKQLDRLDLQRDIMRPPKSAPDRAAATAAARDSRTVPRLTPNRLHL